ncbi:hypothetical protein [Sulfurimonas sp. C5]|uniref:hypothetical protein n=1 Tax=Sulfurimonas sp. C5 TaxID=3036947 RepID=UPI002454D478|nr:hypothetical protein [Sulfurimonas sp. C5]MDH4943533.1 hypothetical protein [Sulfurimonas sp. C5]
MYSNTTDEYNMIEFEDERVNHYLHHFDECNLEQLEYNFEFDCMEPSTELMEEIMWEEY